MTGKDGAEVNRGNTIMKLDGNVRQASRYQAQQLKRAAVGGGPCVQAINDAVTADEQKDCRLEKGLT